MAQIKSKFDFSGIDPDTIDPERLDLGTHLQDCSIIANAYERGAHSTASEAAVFATLNRNVQNTKQFSSMIQGTLKGYLINPQEQANRSVEQANQFGVQSNTGTDISGASSPVDHSLQSLTIGTSNQATFGSSFGDKMLSLVRDCIPCSLRIISFMEMHPHVSLLGVLEADVKRRLGILNDLVDMLKNFDIYGAFCEFLNLLSFLCIPDLQRIIALLMSLLTFEVPRLDGLIGVLASLIIPLFAPILMAITSLLDQYSLIIVNPIDCIIEALNLQLKKLNLTIDPNAPIERISAQFNNGIAELQKRITEIKDKIKQKLQFYVEQVEAMLGEIGTNDVAYLEAQLKRLQIIRLIGFVIAVVKALTQGSLACSSAGKPPQQQEIDQFFDNYLNPNSPFSLYFDDSGNLHIDEKLPEELSSVRNMLQFEGISLIDLSTTQRAEEVAVKLSEPIQAVLPCNLKQTSTVQGSQVNEWIAQLNKI